MNKQKLFKILLPIILLIMIIGLCYYSYNTTKLVDEPKDKYVIAKDFKIKTKVNEKDLKEQILKAIEFNGKPLNKEQMKDVKIVVKDYKEGKLGTYRVIVTYKEQAILEYDLKIEDTVKPVIKVEPLKVNYKQSLATYDDFVKYSKLSVSDDYAKLDVLKKSYKISNYDPNKEGKQVVTISFSDGTNTVTKDVEITVLDEKAEKIKPVKNESNNETASDKETNNDGGSASAPAAPAAPSKPAPAPSKPTPPSSANIDASLGKQIFNLTNAERSKAGLAPFGWDSAIERAVDIRAEEITRSFSHTRPNGTKCFTVLSEVGENVGQSAGENIAMRTTSNDDANLLMGQWMNSQRHKDNILGDFSHVAISCAKINGESYCVQFFRKH
ncbi:MAG: CAP domain-containing protein [Erysipelotrichaceae bacterium]